MKHLAREQGSTQGYQLADWHYDARLFKLTWKIPLSGECVNVD